MAYEVNFVDDSGSEGLAHWQMLLKIKQFAEAIGWVTLRYNAPTNGSNRELIMRGPGLSGDKQIFVGFRTYHNVSADYYNLSVAGFTGYVDSNTFDKQPGYIESGIPAHNKRIDYWLVANGQRIAFGLKIASPVYEHGYAGFFLPYATPSQYPYPLLVGGMLDGIPATRYSDTGHVIYAKGSRNNCRMRFVDGVWKTPDCYPWNTGYTNNIAGNFQIRDTGSNYPLLPILLRDGAPNLYGELDGVYMISGFNNTVESTLTISGATYVVLQDVARNGFTDFIALRLQ